MAPSPEFSLLLQVGALTGSIQDIAREIAHGLAGAGALRLILFCWLSPATNALHLQMVRLLIADCRLSQRFPSVKRPQVRLGPFLYCTRHCLAVR